MAQHSPEVEPIGKRIARYRKLEGWSAQKLAEEARLTRSVVTNIENGRREDLTVSEMLSVCAALRIPPAALMFPIDKPLAPGQVSSSEDGPLFFPRTVDLVEWLGGTDDDYYDDEEAAEFSRKLDELDAVVLYPMGISVWANHGVAGRQARSLIRAGRVLARAQDRADRLRRDVLVMSHLADLRGEEQLYELLDAGTISASPLGEMFVESCELEDRDVVRRLLRASDSAVENLRNARAQFRLLGGDPMPAAGAPSPRYVMELVQASPHEARAQTVARGELADGVVDSPLRVYRDEQRDRIRARFGGDRDGEYSAEA